MLFIQYRNLPESTDGCNYKYLWYSKTECCVPSNGKYVTRQTEYGIPKVLNYATNFRLHIHME